MSRPARPNPPLARTIRLNLIRMRSARGLTQTDLARASRISQGTVALIESGKRAPGLQVIDRLAKGLGCAAIDLLREAA